MIKQGGLQRKSKASSEIPSSSLADIAFLLLIFFMVSTTFPKEKPRRMPWPEAEATQKLDEPRKNIVHIYVDRDGNIFINDALIPPDRVSQVIAPLYQETNQRLVSVIRADREVPYLHIANLQEELKEARAVRVTFYTDLEQRITRRRR